MLRCQERNTRSPPTDKSKTGIPGPATTNGKLFKESVEQTAAFVVVREGQSASLQQVGLLKSSQAALCVPLLPTEAL